MFHSSFQFPITHKQPPWIFSADSLSIYFHTAQWHAYSSISWFLNFRCYLVAGWLLCRDCGASPPNIHHRHCHYCMHTHTWTLTHIAGYTHTPTSYLLVLVTCFHINFSLINTQCLHFLNLSQEVCSSYLFHSYSTVASYGINPGFFFCFVFYVFVTQADSNSFPSSKSPFSILLIASFGAMSPGDSRPAFTGSVAHCVCSPTAILGSHL